jgi:hypothetical protein
MIHSLKHILQLIGLKHLPEAFEGGLVKLYQEIFAEPPYLEYFIDDEVKRIFTNYATKGLLFIAYLPN